MAGVDGLWCLQTAGLDAPNDFKFAGTAVLEDGRFLGGDSVFAYSGNYQVQDGSLNAHVRVYQWNKAVGQAQNVFGMMGPDIDYTANVVIQSLGSSMVGYLSLEDQPELRIAIQMVFIQSWT